MVKRRKLIVNMKKEIIVQLHSFAYKTVAGTIKNYRLALKKPSIQLCFNSHGS